MREIRFRYSQPFITHDVQSGSVKYSEPDTGRHVPRGTSLPSGSFYVSLEQRPTDGNQRKDHCRWDGRIDSVVPSSARGSSCLESSISLLHPSVRPQSSVQRQCQRSKDVIISQSSFIITANFSLQMMLIAFTCKYCSSSSSNGHSVDISTWPQRPSPVQPNE